MCGKEIIGDLQYYVNHLGLDLVSGREPLTVSEQGRKSGFSFFN